jgi:large subunit ribosomal protein L7/L12
MDDQYQRMRMLETQVAYLYRHLGLDPADAVPIASGELTPEVVQLLNSGNKIQAIKAHRERTGVGLAEAKDAIDAFERRYRLG